jgi:3-methyladenine DNA glycosylase AlkD
VARSRTARASVVARRLKAGANPARARLLLRFFKTGPGEYGEGDRFLGLTLPQVREIAREFHTLPLAEIEALLESPWHEARCVAGVILTRQYASADARRQAEIHRAYLRRTNRINNWDLVDLTAPAIVGTHLLNRSRVVLRRLARSKSLWERRIAIVATLAFIRENQFAETFEIAERLLDDRHDLIHKAVGWMLREVGKRDEPALRRFLDRHAATMPRTALRYAIERLSLTSRKRYLAARSRSARQS